MLYRPQASVNAAITAGAASAAAASRTGGPHGWAARAIESAYRLPVRRRSHQTVAVSIAYDTPNLARYLAVYRKHFHLLGR